uniref:Uncharacterized protein n=1 Tax=Candidozyma auris TaxID=498019 RepID=A0A0L0NMY6_CANAR
MELDGRGRKRLKAAQRVVVLNFGTKQAGNQQLHLLSCWIGQGVVHLGSREVAASIATTSASTTAAAEAAAAAPSAVDPR